MPPQAQDLDTLTTSTQAISPADFGYDQARHLLWRAGFGGTPAQIRTLTEWGPARAVDYLLNVEEVEDPDQPVRNSFESDIMQPPSEEEQRQARLARRNQDENALAEIRRRRQMRQRQDRRQIRDIQRWWLTRMIETPRPLEEKMTLFWHGHFATSYRTIENSYHMFMQNQMFRRLGMRNFGELLMALIRDPAMLAYLDNDQNRRGSPNENLAREIMELFSLGEGAYTENDIKEGARALTGYTYEYNEFRFMEQRHDPGQKRILGKRGTFDGDGFVRILLGQKNCAEFICTKLYRYFVSDIPDNRRDPRHRAATSVINQLASTLRAADYDLRPLLRKLFLSRHFYAPQIAATQIKSPVQLIVGAVRSLNTPVRDLSILMDGLDLMGQNLFYPPNVKGWEGGRTWVNTSTLYVRQNIMSFLLTGRTPSGYAPLSSVDRYDPTHLLGDLGRPEPGADRDPQRVVDYLLRFTLGRSPRHAQTKTLVEFINENGGRPTPQVLVGTLALIAAIPEYQLC